MLGIEDQAWQVGREEITINAPVVFMERDVMDFWRVMHISRHKSITSSSIKKTGALVILCT
jgi:hypothetical protein